MFPAAPEETRSPIESVQQVKEKMRTAFAIARENQLSNQKMQKDYYDRLTNGQRFKVGDQVWLHSLVPIGTCAKFHSPWTGPWNIEKRVSDVNYHIVDKKTNKSRIVHFNRLKPYKGLTAVREGSVDTSSSSSDSEMMFQRDLPYSKPKRRSHQQETPRRENDDLMPTVPIPMVGPDHSHASDGKLEPENVAERNVNVGSDSV